LTERAREEGRGERERERKRKRKVSFEIRGKRKRWNELRPAREDGYEGRRWKRKCERQRKRREREREKGITMASSSGPVRFFRTIRYE